MDREIHNQIVAYGLKTQRSDNDSIFNCTENNNQCSISSSHSPEHQMRSLEARSSLNKVKMLLYM
uniref:Uncharacterized protein n=1 Tax=Rhizophora mucronata TaxID=61149 RepID=A0A2P2JMB1_RHIMU